MVVDRRRLWRTASFVARAAAGVAAATRLARAATAARPITATDDEMTSISVVIPARDEADRLPGVLDSIAGAPGVIEVIVVDDRSGDATADIARRAGATVASGVEPPNGWAGKPWAIEQGVAAASGEWIVTLDADTRPDPALPAALIARVVAADLDLVTAAGRFDCPTPGSRWLHASMLTTLVYRYGPPGTEAATPHSLANGQCTAFARSEFHRWGGMAPVAGEVVEDVALARLLAANGRRVGFLDAADLLTVRMYETFASTWRGWGRSIALPGVDGVWRRLAGLAVVGLAQAAPGLRLAARRGDPLDLALAAMRVGTLVGTSRAYRRTDAAYWASPLADPVATAALVIGIVRGRRQTWRGRRYG